jgi:hypothetical protein
MCGLLGTAPLLISLARGTCGSFAVEIRSLDFCCSFFFCLQRLLCGFLSLYILVLALDAAWIHPHVCMRASRRYPRIQTIRTVWMTYSSARLVLSKGIIFAGRPKVESSDMVSVPDRVLVHPLIPSRWLRPAPCPEGLALSDRWLDTGLCNASSRVRSW